jgi:hypothetical protein
VTTSLPLARFCSISVCACAIWSNWYAWPIGTAAVPAATASRKSWTGEAGDAAGARDQVAELLPIRERVSGPEHPDTLAARVNLARWTGQAGDAAGARDQYAELLPIRERVSGPEHPANLARWIERAERGTGQG